MRYSADIDKLAAALRESAQTSSITTQQVLMQAAGYILSEMEARVPVDTGRLKGSLGIRVRSGVVEIGPHGVDYAGYVEDGTRPHDIKPKNKRALAFSVGGTRVVVKSVHHPGTRPQPYVAPSFQAWMDSLGDMAAAANAEVIVKKANQ